MDDRSSRDKVVVGIDLGTTFSAVAYVDDQGQPRVLPTADGKTTTPSVVLIDGDRVAVGEVAMNQWVTNHEHVVRWIKRSMGSTDYRFQGKSAVEISAEILKQLKTDAEASLGQAIDEAVITCPAYFASLEIENTKAAGELAGLRVREIVKEPTAAAVHYGVESMRDGETIMVCDLGGGTYDATVLRYTQGAFVPLATRGDIQLGGHDWTKALEELVVERMQSRFGEDPRDDLVAGQMLYEACEQAKRDLARVTEASVPCQHRGRVEQVTVTRAELEDRAAWLMERVVMRTEEARSKAGLEWKQIDKILMVGGSSRLLSMSAALEAASGMKPVQGREPDLMVALGAAILAKGKVRPRRSAGGLREAPRGGLIDVVYKRSLARSLGTRIVVLDENQPRLTNTLIIPQGTETPVSRARGDLAIASNGQAYFDAPVVEFEDDQDYVVVGNFRFQCRPSARQGDPITLRFHYDVSGIVNVEAIDGRSGASLPFERLPYQEPNVEELAQVRVKPLWVAFALDASSSMRGAKMDSAKRAVIENAALLLEAGGGACRVAVVTFASRADVRCSPTGDLAELRRSVDAIEASGTTAMDDGIIEAMSLVMRAPEGAIRQVVMVTDGVPDDSRRDATVAAAARALGSGVDLVSIALGESGIDMDYLRRLTANVLQVPAIEDLRGAIQFTVLAGQQEASRRGQAATGGGLQEVPGRSSS